MIEDHWWQHRGLAFTSPIRGASMTEFEPRNFLRPCLLLLLRSTRAGTPPPAGGPPRRTYYMTPLGLAWLDAQAHRLEQLHEVLHVFLDRYARLVTADLPPRTETMTGARCSVTGHRSGPTR